MEFSEIITLSQHVAFDIGDTFIQFETMSPKEQWYRIITLLDSHGYVVLERDDRMID